MLGQPKEGNPLSSLPSLTLSPPAGQKPRVSGKGQKGLILNIPKGVEIL